MLAKNSGWALRAGTLRWKEYVQMQIKLKLMVLYYQRVVYLYANFAVHDFPPSDLGFIQVAASYEQLTITIQWRIYVGGPNRKFVVGGSVGGS